MIVMSVAVVPTVVAVELEVELELALDLELDVYRLDEENTVFVAIRWEVVELVS